MAPQTPAEGFKIGLSVCLVFSTETEKKDFFFFAITVFVCICGGYVVVKINDVKRD